MRLEAKYTKDPSQWNSFELQFNNLSHASNLIKGNFSKSHDAAP